MEASPEKAVAGWRARVAGGRPCVAPSHVSLLPAREQVGNGRGRSELLLPVGHGWAWAWNSASKMSFFLLDGPKL